MSVALSSTSSSSSSPFFGPGCFLFLLVAAYTLGAPNGQYIACLQEVKEPGWDTVRIRELSRCGNLKLAHANEYNRVFF